MGFQDLRRTTATGATLPQRVRLSHSDHWAELTADDITQTGVVLSTGPQSTGPQSTGPQQCRMAEQSHVETGDPGFLLHDYTNRMSAVLQAVAAQAPLGAAGTWPGSALHLGAGALTLPRWIEHHWPGIAQTVVDVEPELVDFVLEHLPMRTPPQNVVADAAGVLGDDGALAGRRFDCIVVDLFNSAEAPEELTSAAFYEQAIGSLAPGGLLLVNLGDDDGLAFAARLVDRLLDAVGRTGGEAARSAAGALLTAPDVVLSAGEEGNLVFAARPAVPFADQETQRIWAAGPHPGDVLTGRDLQDWAARV